MPDPIRLVVELAPTRQDFQGNPQQYAEHLVERLRVLFPVGVWTFVIQDTKPPYNQGPWINNGQLWLWSEDEKDYVPLDISASWQIKISTLAPTDPTANADPAITPIWLQYNANYVVGLFVYLNGNWVPVIYVRGNTASRPANPPDFYRYWDTEIGVELYYFRGWKTVAGSPGDIKFVIYATLADALKFNPGWQEVGQVMGPMRGRCLIPAHKDYGTSPAVDIAPLAGITSHFATEYLGGETALITVQQLPAHGHLTWPGALTYVGTGGNTSVGGAFGNTITTVQQVTGQVGSGEGHPNMQPTMALWCLVKGSP